MRLFQSLPCYDARRMPQYAGSVTEQSPNFSTVGLPRTGTGWYIATCPSERRAGSGCLCLVGLLVGRGRLAWWALAVREGRVSFPCFLDNTRVSKCQWAALHLHLSGILSDRSLRIYPTMATSPPPPLLSLVQYSHPSFVRLGLSLSFRCTATAPCCVKEWGL